VHRLASWKIIGSLWILTGAVAIALVTELTLPGEAAPAAQRSSDGWPVAHGTAIIALETDDAVVIGADSRQVHGRLTASEGFVRQGFDDHACKVMEQNGVVFALAGPAQLPPDGREAVPLALSIMSSKRNLQDMTRDFASQTLPALARDTRLLTGRETPESVDGKIVFGFLFGTIERRRPAVRIVYFVFHAAGAERLTILDADLPNRRHPEQRLLALGRALALDAADYPKPRGRRDRAWGMTAIRDLMQLVARQGDNATFVGGDIDFAIIDGRRIDMRVKPECRGVATAPK
jgi:hypothetical protein